MATITAIGGGTLRDLLLDRHRRCRRGVVYLLLRALDVPPAFADAAGMLVVALRLVAIRWDLHLPVLRKS